MLSDELDNSAVAAGSGVFAGLMVSVSSAVAAGSGVFAGLTFSVSSAAGVAGSALFSIACDWRHPAHMIMAAEIISARISIVSLFCMNIF